MGRPILCPRCRRLTTDDEEACGHCGLRRPGSRLHGALSPLLRLDGEGLVRALVWTNVGIFALSLVLFPRGGGLSAHPFALLSPPRESLLLLGETGTVPIDGYGRWWTLLAANYLHGGLLHLLFNLMALRQIGPFVGREFGVHRLAAIYTLGGVAGFGLSYVAGVPLTIGASGAVCALIGSALFYGRDRGGAYGRAVFQTVWGWTVGIFLFGFLFPGINNWGHGGGLAAGFLLAWALGYEERRREGRLDRWLGLGCAAATVGVLLWAVGTALLVRFAG